MTIHHITIAVRGRRVLAADEAQRRWRVRRIAVVAGDQLLLFCLVDDHLHAVVRALRPRHVARDLGRVLSARRRPGELVLKPPSVEPVETRAHLRSLVRYLLEQPARHELPGSPALWSGSCFPDLVGARLLPGFNAGVLRSELPRLRLRELFEHVGLEPTQLIPPDDGALRDAGPARISQLVAAVFAVGPKLTGRQRPVVEARALAARAGASVGVPTSELARCLGVTPSQVRRLARLELPGRALAALHKRWALEERVRGLLAPG